VLEAVTNLFTLKYRHFEIAWMNLRRVQRRAFVNTTTDVIFISETGSFLSIVTPILFSRERSFMELAKAQLVL
jgi:hypothetical protein